MEKSSISSAISKPIKKKKIKVISDKDQKFIDAKMDRFVRRRRFNGSIIIAKDNEIVYDTVNGYANIRRRIPLTDTSAMQLASITKPITAAVVMSLVQEGKIKLSDIITDYLPELPDNYKKINVKMLLSHRSGLTQYYYYCDHVLDNRDEFTLYNDSLLCVINEHNPGFAARPGKKFQYCNTNYALLASLCERVEGKRFHDIVQERIIEPSGMEHSFLLDLKEDSLPKNLVYGNNLRNKLMEFDYLDGIVGDKGFFSTADDLFKFDKYYFNCLMIGDSLMNRCFTPQSKANRMGTTYGMGWRIREDKKIGKIIYHPGWWRGNRHLYFRIPSKGYTVIMLSNSLRGSVYNLNDMLSMFYELD